SRAAALGMYLNDPAPYGIREVKVAGDAHSTRLYLGMRANNTHPEAWLFTMAEGDGTVPKWSAANNLAFDSLAGTLQSFYEHATIFDDRWVQDQLSRELTEDVPPKELAIAGPGNPTLRVTMGGKEAIWTLKSVTILPESATVSKAANIAADLILTLDERDRAT